MIFTYKENWAEKTGLKTWEPQIYTKFPSEKISETKGLNYLYFQHKNLNL